MITSIYALKNRIIFGGKKEMIKILFILSLALAFSIGSYLIFFKILLYFNKTDIIGKFLIIKLFSLIFLTFFSFIYFSNIITGLSTFYLSSDVNLYLASPVSYYRIVNMKYWQTFVQSSWMIIFFSLPVFYSLGRVINADIMFYIIIFSSFIPFVIIASLFGVITTGILAKLFSVRRTKWILFVLGLTFGIGFYLYIRFLKPEQFVDPEKFLTLTSYLATLRSADNIFLPTTWIIKIITYLMDKDYFNKEILYYFSLLWINALFFYMIMLEVVSRLFFSSWSNAQEGRQKRITLPWFNKIKNPIIRKDLLIFFRDPSQWSQLFLLLSLVIVYIFNFSALPLEKSPLPTLYLKNLLSFINLGLAGFVLSAISVRFAFPCISTEKASLMLIKASPFSLKKYLYSKYIFNFYPLLILSIILICVTNIILKTDKFVFYLSFITIIFLTSGLTSLSISLGIIFPVLKFENRSSISSSFGGLVCMLISIFFIGAVIILEAHPVSRILWAEVFGRQLSFKATLGIYFSFIAVFLLNLAVLIIPLKIGFKKLCEMEF
ncbi:MAG: hypothetical protein PHX78_00285 [bacterium]|nr:hypothetical protein [bacterium]